MSSKPWTDAHRREALRRTYEIAAELARHGTLYSADVLRGNRRDEAEFRDAMAAAGFAAARVNREVRRVRDLAEGRMVRETLYRVYHQRDTRIVDWPTRNLAEAWVMGHAPKGARIVRIARIRKAP